MLLHERPGSCSQPARPPAHPSLAQRHLQRAVGCPADATAALTRALHPPAPCTRLQNLAAWQQFAAGPPNNQPPNTPSLHNSVFYPPPGSYNSPDRFTRLAILKQASGWAPWK